MTPLQQLIKAAEDLYFAGYWHCDRPVEEEKLWTALRDAAGIPPGHTAEVLGPDRSITPPEGAAMKPAMMGEAMFRDAMRYRWLRDTAKVGNPFPAAPKGAPPFQISFRLDAWGETLDEVIDSHLPQRKELT